jgi:hypothetical protein
MEEFILRIWAENEFSEVAHIPRNLEELLFEHPCVFDGPEPKRARVHRPRIYERDRGVMFQLLAHHPHRGFFSVFRNVFFHDSERILLFGDPPEGEIIGSGALFEPAFVDGRRPHEESDAIVAFRNDELLVRRLDADDAVRAEPVAEHDLSGRFPRAVDELLHLRGHVLGSPVKPLIEIPYFNRFCFPADRLQLRLHDLAGDDNRRFSFYRRTV